MSNLGCTYSAISDNDFRITWNRIRDDFIDGRADGVDTGHWQSLKNVPHTRTLELPHTTIYVPIKATRGSWASFMHPNLPWAEDHFQERIGGPANPGEQFKNWPWYKGGVEDHKPNGKFSHTYMERFWPSRDEDGNRRHGIRYKLGDLENLMHLLAREPHTRQAYLPIWFPEDIYAASVDHQRVPCTLGYHFLVRQERMHCFYPMRSVDFVRYLRDDLYMAGRLVQHLCKGVEGFFEKGIKPGILTLFASSLHVFEADLSKLHRDREAHVW